MSVVNLLYLIVGIGIVFSGLWNDLKQLSVKEIKKIATVILLFLVLVKCYLPNMISTFVLYILPSGIIISNTIMRLLTKAGVINTSFGYILLVILSCPIFKILNFRADNVYLIFLALVFVMSFIISARFDRRYLIKSLYAGIILGLICTIDNKVIDAVIITYFVNLITWLIRIFRDKTGERKKKTINLVMNHICILIGGLCIIALLGNVGSVPGKVEIWNIRTVFIVLYAIIVIMTILISVLNGGLRFEVFGLTTMIVGIVLTQVIFGINAIVYILPNVLFIVGIFGGILSNYTKVFRILFQQIILFIVGITFVLSWF